MATLRARVHVMDAEGRSHVFGPSDDVPRWAQEQITNPKAWAEPPVAPAPEPAPVPAPVKATAKRAAPRRKGAVSGAVHGN